MVRSNQKIYPIILEIMLLITFVFITYFMWNNNHMESYSSIAASYASNSAIAFDVEGKINNDLLFPITEQEAREQTPAILKIKSSGVATNGMVALQIAKDSTLDYRYLNLLVDDEVVSLKDSVLYEDEENYYIPIYSGEIHNEVKEVALYLYLDENVGNEAQNKSIKLDIALIENQAL